MSEERVNHPTHYRGENGVECIDAIESVTSLYEGFSGYCIGNILKYVWRHRLKGGIQDLEKAKWYIDRLISYYEEEDKKKGIWKEKTNEGKGV